MLNEKEEKQFGAYRTRRLVLEAYDRLAEDPRFRDKISNIHVGFAHFRSDHKRLVARGPKRFRRAPTEDCDRRQRSVQARFQERGGSRQK